MFVRVGLDYGKRVGKMGDRKHDCHQIGLQNIKRVRYLVINGRAYKVVYLS